MIGHTLSVCFLYTAYIDILVYVYVTTSPTMKPKAVYKSEK